MAAMPSSRPRRKAGGEGDHGEGGWKGAGVENHGADGVCVNGGWLFEEVSGGCHCCRYRIMISVDETLIDMFSVES